MMKKNQQPPHNLTSKLRRGELMDAKCPSREVLKHMTSRWGVLVLVVLLDGTHRFSELRGKIGGISEKMLSQTLQGLEGDGLVHRLSHPVVPPHVEYTLTKMGEQAASRVEAMVDWIEENMHEIMRFKQEGNALESV